MVQMYWGMANGQPALEFLWSWLANGTLSNEGLYFCEKCRLFPGMCQGQIALIIKSHTRGIDNDGYCELMSAILIGVAAPGI